MTLLNRNKYLIMLGFLLLLLIVTLLAYQGSFQGAFVFDDIEAIVKNPHIRDLGNIGRVLTAPPRSSIRDRPVVGLTLALNYALGGLDEKVYHLFNLIIHILAGWTLYGIIRRTFLNRLLPPRYHRAAAGLALSITALWLVHPLQTESVTYIIQRSESLAGLFYLATLYFFIRGASSEAGRLWYILSVLCCALGMGTKSTMITAPLTVFIYDAVFCSRSPRRAFLNHRPFYSGLAATWLIQIYLLFRTSYADLAGLSPVSYLLTQPGVVAHYIRLAFLPHPLCFDYGWPLAEGAGQVIPFALFIGALLWLTVTVLRKKPALGFAGIWFFLILAPTSSILPLEDPASEHRMYLPLIALLAVVVVFLFEISKRIPSTGFRRAGRYLLTGAAVGIFIFLTHRRNLLYRDPLLLWEDVVRQRPLHARGHYNLGVELTRRERKDEAINHYQKAVSLRPGYVDALNNLGTILVEKGKYRQALGYYGKILQINPYFWKARFNMGIALARLKKYREAVTSFREVLRVRPEFAPALFFTGDSLSRMGKIPEGITFYQQALKLDSDYINPIYNRGVELTNQNRRKDAIAVFEMILRLQPRYNPAREALKIIQQNPKRNPE